MKSALLVSLSLVALLTACIGADSNGPAPALPGAYRLVSVNGSLVPAVAQNDAAIKTEVLSGELIMGGGHLFSESQQVRIIVNGGASSPVTVTATGTWNTPATYVSFISGLPDNPVRFAGTYASGILTYTKSGSTFAYARESVCNNC